MSVWPLDGMSGSAPSSSRKSTIIELPAKVAIPRGLFPSSSSSSMSMLLPIAPASYLVSPSVRSSDIVRCLVSTCALMRDRALFPLFQSHFQSAVSRLRLSEHGLPVDKRATPLISFASRSDMRSICRSERALNRSRSDPE